MKEKKLILKLILEDKNIFYHWARGVKLKIESILENKKATKKEIIEELKEIYKLFK